MQWLAQLAPVYLKQALIARINPPTYAALATNDGHSLARKYDDSISHSSFFTCRVTSQHPFKPCYCLAQAEAATEPIPNREEETLMLFICSSREIYCVVTAGFEK